MKKAEGDSYGILLQDTRNRVPNKNGRSRKIIYHKGFEGKQAIEMKLQSSRDMQGLKEKIKISDIRNKRNPHTTSSGPEFIHPKHPVK
ncbi:hypothetical protein TNCT_340951 [Trichonephila clavata]|uniref:Uncharacterized protein n=1 Tax=Trichonephila clavata TaxID=2740835 RepID=A0A8X6FHY7_TRICU|nr:hypothetical protein TNCT_340951 [Trichonephila clavata]